MKIDLKSEKRIVFLGFILCFILMILQFLLQIRYLLAPLGFDYDEGVYWQTIRLLNRGYALFSDIFYSQFPLFIQITRFFHNVFSESLFGARFAILLMALPLIPIMYCLGVVSLNHRAGIIAAVLTCLNVPIFTGSHVLQGDAPALTFALASLACALMLYRYQGNFLGFYLPIGASAFLFAISLQLKMLALPGLVAIYSALLLKLFENRNIKGRRKYVKVLLELSLIFFLSTGACFFTMLLLTGWSPNIGLSQLNAGVFSTFFENPDFKHIHWNELLDRIQMFLDNMGRSKTKNYFEPMLCLFLPLFTRNKRPLFISLIWLFTYIFAFLLYKESNSHYLIFLEPAYIMIISLSVTPFFCEMLSTPIKINPIRKVFLFALLFVVFVNISVNLYRLVLPDKTLKRIEKRFKKRDFVEFIQNIQKVIPKEQFIITDKQVLISVADRDVPPWLVDTCSARVRSGTLDCKKLLASVNDIHTGGILLSELDRFKRLECNEEFKEAIKKRFPHSKRYSFRRRFLFLFWKTY